MIHRVILAVSDKRFRNELRTLFDQSDTLVESLNTGRRLWEHLSSESGDLIVVSQDLVGEAQRLEVLRELPDAPVLVVVQDQPDAKTEAVLLAAGCDAVLTRGLSRDVLKQALSALLEKRAKILQESITAKRITGADPRFTDFVSKSPSMHTFMNVVMRVVQSDVSLFILGETGVGKEHLARAIHAEGKRSQGPFIAVNCGALPESLLESELFGHERGAFTGATRSRRGWFEMAHNGTVFLDEIGELRPHLQVKLLRVLQNREIQRVGGEHPIKVDVRIMAATNRPIEKDMENGTFRKDLFYRLSVVTLTVPPLRERKEDIPELVDNYIRVFSSRIGKYVGGIAPDALDALIRYAWPGNVRELINVIERGAILSESETITLQDLPQTIGNPLQGADNYRQRLGQPHLDFPFRPELPLKKARHLLLQAFEQAYLEHHLRQTSGNIRATSQKAGIQPRALFDKMKRLRLRKEDYKR